MVVCLILGWDDVITTIACSNFVPKILFSLIRSIKILILNTYT
jgi:hypothetical protein